MSTQEIVLVLTHNQHMDNTDIIYDIFFFVFLIKPLHFTIDCVIYKVQVGQINS